MQGAPRQHVRAVRVGQHGPVRVRGRVRRRRVHR